MQNVSVGIKTFIRRAEPERALESLVGRGFAEVIVADDSRMDDARRAMYAKFKDRLPLKVLELPFNTGVSYGRNRMVEACRSPYFLLMDDDQYVQGDLSPMLEILESNDQLGAVSALADTAGKFHSSAVNLYKFGPFMVLDIGHGPHRDAQYSPAGNSFSCYDMIANFALFRTATFEDVLWDETLVTNREHEDFFLSHKALGKWQFAVTPACTFGHGSLSSGEIAVEYNKFRVNPETIAALSRYFNDKWGLKHHVIWGMSHLPKRRGPKARLLHFLVLIGQLLHADQRA